MTEQDVNFGLDEVCHQSMSTSSSSTLVGVVGEHLVGEVGGRWQSTSCDSMEFHEGLMEVHWSVLS